MEGPPRKKKKRTENWSLSDKALLKSLVEDNFAIIENKKTDTNTNKCKKDCWDSILTLFNATSNVSREVSQLQFQWRFMKQKAKTESNCRNKLEDSAGPVPKPPDKECTDVMDLIPNDFKIDFNKFEINDVQQNSATNDIPLSQIKNEYADEEYGDYLLLENNTDESNVSTITPCILSTSTPKDIPYSVNSSRVVPKRKLPRSSKKNNKNNDEMKYKYEIFELTKKYMREEHQQRMENLRLEKECRLKEMKKLDLEIEMKRKKWCATCQ